MTLYPLYFCIGSSFTANTAITLAMSEDNIVTIVIVGVTHLMALVAAYVAMSNRLAKLETKSNNDFNDIEELKETIRGSNEIITQLTIKIGTLHCMRDNPLQECNNGQAQQ